MTIELQQVKKIYNNFELDCSLRMESGRITALIGKNGAGKSTAFKLLLGLIKADEGKVVIDGKEVSCLSEKERESLGVALADSGFGSYFKLKDVVAVMKAAYPKFEKEAFLQKCDKIGIPNNKQIREFPPVRKQN